MDDVGLSEQKHSEYAYEVIMGGACVPHTGSRQSGPHPARQSSSSGGKLYAPSHNAPRGVKQTSVKGSARKYSTFDEELDKLLDNCWFSLV